MTRHHTRTDQFRLLPGLPRDLKQINGCPNVSPRRSRQRSGKQFAAAKLRENPSGVRGKIMEKRGDSCMHWIWFGGFNSLETYESVFSIIPSKG